MKRIVINTISTPMWFKRNQTLSTALSLFFSTPFVSKGWRHHTKFYGHINSFFSKSIHKILCSNTDCSNLQTGAYPISHPWHIIAVEILFSYIPCGKCCFNVYYMCVPSSRCVPSRRCSQVCTNQQVCTGVYQVAGIEHGSFIPNKSCIIGTNMVFCKFCLENHCLPVNKV